MVETTAHPTQEFREGRSALWDVEQWRSQSRGFADMATFDAVSTTLTEADGVEQIVGASISPNLLAVIGVRPVLGRSFSAEEAEQRQRPVQSVVRRHFHRSVDLHCGLLPADRGRCRGLLPPRATRHED